MSGADGTGLTDRLGIIAPTDPETRARAARYVHRHATCATDAALLLEALDLADLGDA